jgi:hypothetical protein
MASLCFMCILGLLLSILHKTHTNESLFIVVVYMLYVKHRKINYSVLGGHLN